MFLSPSSLSLSLSLSVPLSLCLSLMSHGDCAYRWRCVTWEIQKGHVLSINTHTHTTVCACLHVSNTYTHRCMVTCTHSHTHTNTHPHMDQTGHPCIPTCGRAVPSVQSSVLGCRAALFPWALEGHSQQYENTLLPNCVSVCVCVREGGLRRLGSTQLMPVWVH